MQKTTTAQLWNTAISAAPADTQLLKVAPGQGTATLPLITRTGFEIRNIVTSQIGSL